jgi:methyl-accepting chemotaxis protein
MNWLTTKVNENFNTNFGDIELSETLKERCGQIIRNEFENNVNIKSQGWFNSLKKGGNQDYETKILRRVVKACVLLVKEWESLDLNHNSYLQGLDVNIPKLSGDIRRDMEKFSSIGFDGAVDKSIEKPFQDISITFASLYFLFLFDFVFPGLGMVLFTAAVVAIVIISRFKSKEDYISDISDKINEELEKGVKLNQGDITVKLQEKLQVVRNFYLHSITNSFKKMSKQLEQRIEEAKAIFSSTQSERDKIAYIAKDFRQSDIEPLRQELKKFKSSVEDIWKEPS